MSRIEKIINYLDKRIRPDPMDSLTDVHAAQIKFAKPEVLGDVLIEIRKEVGYKMPNIYDILQFYHFKRIDDREIEPNIKPYIDYLNKT